MKSLVLTCLLAALPVSIFAAGEPAGVDALGPDDVAKAVAALKQNYVHPEDLSDAEIARATLQGLLDRLSPAVTLVSGSGSAEKAAPFYSELYGGRTGYLRVGDFSNDNVAKAAGTIKDWNAKNVGAVVLDLRGTPPNGDFDTGAALAEMFCAKGTQLFSLESIPASGAQAKDGSIPMSQMTMEYVVKNPPAQYKGVLVVLVDGDTAEAPEAVAASLQKCAKALIVGDRTAGKPFKFTDVPLSGAVLRMATAQVILPDGKQPGEGGLMPDISIGIGAANKPDVMKSITSSGVGSVVQEQSRPHLNEAALVAHNNPEVDEIEAEQSGRKPPEPLLDRQLQRALDLLTSISIYQTRATGFSAPAGQ